MLVLGIKDGESVHIGDNIRIKVLSRKNGQTRIGFEAPESVKILRESLIDECCEADDIQESAA